jgi:hypothetical protein
MLEGRIVLGLQLSLWWNCFMGASEASYQYWWAGGSAAGTSLAHVENHTADLDENLLFCEKCSLRSRYDQD